MKIAFIISGEYRTFATCLPTMRFLDDPRVDVYLSFWDTSHIKNDRLSLDIREDVTLEKVTMVMGQKPFNLILENADNFKLRKYNSKMVWRWQAGAQAVADSGIVYDYIFVLRPDLFFSGTDYYTGFIDTLLSNSLQFIWYDKDRILQDCFWGGPTHHVLSILGRDVNTSWNQSVETDWHRWWGRYVGSTYAGSIGALNAPITFCRFTVQEVCSYHDVIDSYNAWRDSQILDFIDIHGSTKQPRLSWGDDIVDSAIGRLKSGYFDKFSKPKLKILLIYAGDTGSSDAAILSQPIWGDNVDCVVAHWSHDKKALQFLEKIKPIKSFSIDIEEYIAATAPLKNKTELKTLFMMKKIISQLPEGYDRHIIIRPDSFCWLRSAEMLKRGLHKVSCVSTNQHSVSMQHKVLMDSVIIFAPTGKDTIGNAFDLAMTEAEARTANNLSVDKHYLLYDIWSAIDGICLDELSFGVEAIYVRDTFRLIAGDYYSYSLYRDIFYDSAAWWRNHHGSNFNGTLYNESEIL